MLKGCLIALSDFQHVKKIVIFLLILSQAENLSECAAKKLGKKYCFTIQIAVVELTHCSYMVGF